MLGEVTDACATATITRWKAQHGGVSTCPADNAQQDLHQRRLASPIGTEQREDFARTHVKRNALQRVDSLFECSLVLFLDVVHCDN